MLGVAIVALVSTDGVKSLLITVLSSIFSYPRASLAKRLFTALQKR